MMTASIDMGAEQMVMALASVENGNYHLTGVKRIASQGMACGKVKEVEKVRNGLHVLMSELVKERRIDVLNIALSGRALCVSVRRVTVPVQKRCVEQGDLQRAEACCRKNWDAGDKELVDLIPVAYSLDHGKGIADPLGRPAQNLEVTYQVYAAEQTYLKLLRSLFDEYDIAHICFYPLAHAYAEALDTTIAPGVAVVDMGAGGMQVTLFRDGMLEYDAHLPLGVRTIDMDIMEAFGVTTQQARKLKNEYGQALRYHCKNRKVVIPDTRLTLESRDLAMVVQSRAEELLEGVVYLLQSWEFNQPEDTILLAGGGSRIQDIDLLLNHYTGHPVGRAKAKRLQASEPKVLETPEYLVALGLLMCNSSENENGKGWKGALGKTLKSILGI